MPPIILKPGILQQRLEPVVIPQRRHPRSEEELRVPTFIRTGRRHPAARGRRRRRHNRFTDVEASTPARRSERATTGSLPMVAAHLPAKISKLAYTSAVRHAPPRERASGESRSPWAANFQSEFRSIGCGRRGGRRESRSWKSSQAISFRDTVHHSRGPPLREGGREPTAPGHQQLTDRYIGSLRSWRSVWARPADQLPLRNG